MITVWNDGSFLAQSELDAYYSANDSDWLVNIPMEEVIHNGTYICRS